MLGQYGRLHDSILTDFRWIWEAFASETFASETFALGESADCSGSQLDSNVTSVSTH